MSKYYIVDQQISENVDQLTENKNSIQKNTIINLQSEMCLRKNQTRIDQKSYWMIGAKKWNIRDKRSELGDYTSMGKQETSKW